MRSSNEGTKERIARHVNENLPNTFQQSEITQFLNQMEDDGDLIVVLKNEVRFYELI